jgi:hypothetical protein
MKKIKTDLLLLVSFLICVTITYKTTAQKTKIRGFIEANTSFEDDIWSFGLGEQDLFITSEINDDISFLSETVFKYSSSSSKFEVSIERVIINYNYKGNHNFLIGKHHTPINYWNDTYHHGRVFFPTIDRPLLFSANIIPIHTTGIAFQGLNLGKLKFGYNLMIGNGIGSEEIEDNDKYKSLTATVHIKPIENLQFGLSYYNDVISEGSDVHGNHFIAQENIKQQLLTASVAYFGDKFEVLAEGTFSSNKGDVLGTTNAFISYFYGGVKLKEKWVPYIRLDNFNFNKDEFFFNTPNTTSFVTGIRYEINYLAVVKLEYQHTDRDVLGSANKLTAQIAIGF